MAMEAAGGNSASSCRRFLRLASIPHYARTDRQAVQNCSQDKTSTRASRTHPSFNRGLLVRYHIEQGAMIMLERQIGSDRSSALTSERTLRDRKHFAVRSGR